MTKVKIGYVSPLERLLDELPDKQKKVSLKQAMEMRRALYIGMHEASLFLKKCSTVDEATDLYHKINRRLVEMEEEEMKKLFTEICG